MTTSTQSPPETDARTRGRQVALWAVAVGAICAGLIADRVAAGLGPVGKSIINNDGHKCYICPNAPSHAKVCNENNAEIIRICPSEDQLIECQEDGSYDCYFP